jgi:adenine-specific DNA-methyltransferase
LIVKDTHGLDVISEQYNPAMLVAAVAKLNGFSYSPQPDCYWRHGKAMGNSWIYVTTQYFTAKELDEIARDVLPDETLVICAPAFDVGLGKRYENIKLRKIPQSVLDKCEYGVDNYNLNVVDVPDLSGEEAFDDEP